MISRDIPPFGVARKASAALLLFRLIPFLLIFGKATASDFVFLEEQSKAVSYSDIITAARGEAATATYHSDSSWKDLTVLPGGMVLALSDANPPVLHQFTDLNSWQTTALAKFATTMTANWRALSINPVDSTVWVLSEDGLSVQQFASTLALTSFTPPVSTLRLDTSWDSFEFNSRGGISALHHNGTLLYEFSKTTAWQGIQHSLSVLDIHQPRLGIGKTSPNLPSPVSADAFQPFLNLPEELASFSDYTVAPAFPSLSFVDPSAMVADPLGGGFFVSERIGRLYRIDADEQAPNKQLLLDIRPNVGVGHDTGLYNFAFHPNYAQNGYIYLYYTWKEPSTTVRSGWNHQRDFFGLYLRLSRFTVDTSTLTIDPTTEVPYFNVRLYNQSHRGSGLLFGDDGFLYLTIGEQSRYQTAQDLANTFEGGVLRIDVDQQGGNISHPPRRKMGIDAGETDEWSGEGYNIPSDNPFLDQNGGLFEEFASLGNRNPYRMVKDSQTGEMFIGEVGRSDRDEINRWVRGANYEWPHMEGTFQRGQFPSQFLGTRTPPLVDFTPSEVRSIIVGLVYHGTKFPALEGKLICSDYASNQVLAVNPSNGDFQQFDGLTGIVGFGEDPFDDNIYLFAGDTDGNTTVGLSKLIDNSPTPPPPSLLSQTGIFSNLGTLQPAPGLTPYQPISPLWSDGAAKKRWMGVPNDGKRDSWSETILLDHNLGHRFPFGTLFVKHFEFEDQPVETRVLANSSKNGWYGLSYKWRPDGSDADLVGPAGEDATLSVQGETLQWRFPSHLQCAQCHTEAAGRILGLKEHQLNSFYDYASGQANQLIHLGETGQIQPAYSPSTLASIVTAKPLEDTTASLPSRVRSYLDSNCSHCHQPDGPGGRALFDARFTTPLGAQELIRGDVIEDLGIFGAKVILPGIPDASILLKRINSLEGCCQMPPLARNRVDSDAVLTLARWIWQLDPDSSDPDTDGDGLRDEWELTYAADLNVLGTKDTDGDGHSDHDEFLLGTNPVDSSSRLLLSLDFSNPTEPTLNWDGILGKGYRVHSSPDLQNWNPSSSRFWGSGDTSTAPLPNSDLKSFFRLTVE